MIIQTKGKRGLVHEKEVLVGSGIIFTMPGMRYTVTAEVTEIHEASNYAVAKMLDGKVLSVPAQSILDVVTPGNMAVFSANAQVDVSDLQGD